MPATQAPWDSSVRSIRVLLMPRRDNIQTVCMELTYPDLHTDSTYDKELRWEVPIAGLRTAYDQDQARAPVRGDPAAAGERRAHAVRRARIRGGGHRGDRPGRRGDPRRPVPPVPRQGGP